MACSKRAAPSRRVRARSPPSRSRTTTRPAIQVHDEPAPTNLCAAAAPGLRMTENRLRVYANQVRETINRDRARPLPTLEDLGHYLVFDTRAVTRADLSR